ncbi:sugar ABC transporter ATP-binding protein, partial [Mycobacterium tuberculosis]|nr:sugar ABC transporter ATP-binding protein [Mycobacterium tuberculosis]
LSVAENIFIGRERTRAGVHIDRAAQAEGARQLMRRLEQDIAPDTPLGNLRIGQQQIVEIAKALAQDARILILDEPTSALDATVQAEILRLIEELVTTRGMGLILISHDLPLVSHFCDRVLVM